LAICCARDRVVEAIAGTLGAYPDGMAIGGRLELRIDVVPDAEGDPGWPEVTAEHLPGRLVVRCGGSRADVDQMAGLAAITLSESLAAITDAVRLFAEAAFTSVHVAQGRLHAVHSALVAHHGAGLLLRGPSGAGKSTLTYSCLRRGMHMVSDDWVYAPATGSVGDFAGYPWRMMMTSEAAARFPELAGVELVPHTSAEGWKVPVVPPPHQRHATHRVDAVVLLDPSANLELRQASPEEALHRFWEASLPVERDHLDAAWVHDLLARPTYVLHRGTSPDEAARLLEELATRCPTSC
jgi:hypothetical protein